VVGEDFGDGSSDVDDWFWGKLVLDGMMVLQTGEGKGWNWGKAEKWYELRRGTGWGIEGRIGALG